MAKISAFDEAQIWALALWRLVKEQLWGPLTRQVRVWAPKAITMLVWAMVWVGQLYPAEDRGRAWNQRPEPEENLKLVLPRECGQPLEAFGGHRQVKVHQLYDRQVLSVLRGRHTKVNQTQTWPSSGSQFGLHIWAKRSFQYNYTCVTISPASQPLYWASLGLAWPLKNHQSLSACFSLVSGCVCVIYALVTLWVTAYLPGGIVSPTNKPCHLELLFIPEYVFSNRGPQAKHIPEWRFFSYASYIEIPPVYWSNWVLVIAKCYN